MGAGVNDEEMEVLHDRITRALSKKMCLNPPWHHYSAEVIIGIVTATVADTLLIMNGDVRLEDFE